MESKVQKPLNPCSLKVELSLLQYYPQWAHPILDTPIPYSACNQWQTYLLELDRWLLWPLSSELLDYCHYGVTFASVCVNWWCSWFQIIETSSWVDCSLLSVERTEVERIPMVRIRTENLRVGEGVSLYLESLLCKSQRCRVLGDCVFFIWQKMVSVKS